MSRGPGPREQFIETGDRVPGRYFRSGVTHPVLCLGKRGSDEGLLEPACDGQPSGRR